RRHDEVSEECAGPTTLDRFSGGTRASGFSSAYCSPMLLFPPVPSYCRQSSMPWSSARRAHGLSIRDMATLTGVQPADVAAFEMGKLQHPRTVKRPAVALDLEMEYLLELRRESHGERFG